MSLMNFNLNGNHNSDLVSNCRLRKPTLKAAAAISTSTLPYSNDLNNDTISPIHGPQSPSNPVAPNKRHRRTFLRPRSFRKRHHRPPHLVPCNTIHFGIHRDTP